MHPLRALLVAGLLAPLLLIVLPAAITRADEDVSSSTPPADTLDTPAPDAGQASSTDATTTSDTDASSTDTNQSAPTEGTTTPPVPDWFLRDHPWAGSASSPDATTTPPWFGRFRDPSSWLTNNDDSNATSTPDHPFLLHTPIVHPKSIPGGRGARSQNDRVSGQVISVRNSSVVITAGGRASAVTTHGMSVTKGAVTIQLPTNDPNVRLRTISIGQRIAAVGSTTSEGNFTASSVRILADAPPIATTTPSLRTWTRPIRPPGTTRHGR